MSLSLTVIDPFDPLGAKVGGAETFLKAFLRFAPSDFDIRFFGVTSDAIRRPPRVWSMVRLGDRSFSFFPLFFVRDENVRKKIPLSLRFSLRWKALRPDLLPGVLLFNRFESAWAVRKSPQGKIAFVHNDIPRQVLGHGGEVLWSRWPGLFLRVEKRLIPALDLVYTPCATSVEHYGGRFPEMARAGKFRILDSLVDPDLFSPTDEDKAVLRRRLLPDREEFHGGTKWILFSGRLQEQKAPLRIIESFAELSRRDDKVRLLIAGTGNLLDDVKAGIAARSLGRRVHLAGRIDPASLPDYYRASDALLLTSLYEGLPFCVLEALSCGLPVVTTDAGAVARIVKNGFSGEIVPEYSPEAVAAALESVLSRPDVYRRANCLESVSDFTPVRVLDPIYRCIRDLRTARGPQAERA